MAAADPFATLLDAPRVFARATAREAGTDAEAETLGAVLGEVRLFCRDHVDATAIDRRGALGPELLAAAAARGLFGLTVPAQLGGVGLSLKATARVMTELAAHDGSLATCIGLHAGLGSHALLHRGTLEQKERYLPSLATGARIASFAATEPGAGSDISAVKTRLSETEGVLTLTGSKCYVTNGGLCGLVTVLARSPGLGGARAGHTLVLVDPAWRGVARGREEHKLGLRGSSTVTLDFDDVVIPEANVLGAISHGLEDTHAALAWGRTLMAAGCLGTARGAIAEARAHVEGRSQFGRPLAQFPLVRATLAGAIADLYAAESVLRVVGELAASGSADLGVASTIAKVQASEAAWGIVDRILQLLGGAGYIEDTGMARRLRDVRVTRIFEGSNEVLRLHLASSVLTWALDRGRSRALRDWASPALADRASDVDGDLAQLVTLLRATRDARGFRLFQDQTLQVRLANAVLAAYSLLCVLLRMPAAMSPRETAIASLAFHRCERRLASAIRAIAEEEDAPASLVDAIL